MNRTAFPRLLVPLLLLAVFAGMAPAAAQEEKVHFKLGLVLGEKKDRRFDGDVLNVATDAFVDAKRFTMAERSKLDAVFTEKDLQEFIGGQVNNKLSDVLDLDLVGVVGYTVDTTRDSEGKPVTNWTIDVRLIEVKTASILATLTSERPNLLPAATVRDAGERLFRNIREAFPPLGYVIKVAGKEVVVDLGSEAGLKEGDVLEVLEEGEQIIHPKSGKVYAGPLAVVGKLKVVATAPQISTCKLKSLKGELQLTHLVRLEVRDSTLTKWFLKVPQWKAELQKKREELRD